MRVIGYRHQRTLASVAELPGGGRVKVVVGTIRVDGREIAGPIHGGATDPTYLDVELPAGVSFREGALVEPLAVGLHAVNKARLEGGERVMVIGAGPIGLAVTAWARFFGARAVVVNEKTPGRIALAQKFGATNRLDDVAAANDCPISFTVTPSWPASWRSMLTLIAG